jgi:hypothetical protein
MRARSFHSRGDIAADRLLHGSHPVEPVAPDGLKLRHEQGYLVSHFLTRRMRAYAVVITDQK